MFSGSSKLPIPRETRKTRDISRHEEQEDMREKAHGPKHSSMEYGTSHAPFASDDVDEPLMEGGPLSVVRLGACCIQER